MKLTPDVKDFGTVNVGETPSQEFTITTENTDATLTASIDNTTDYAVSAIAGNKVTVTYQPQSAGTHSAVLTVKAGEEATATVNLTGKAVQALEGTWILVTDASSLKAGDEIIIAAKEYDVALSTTQNNNNRGEVAITKNQNTITATSEAQVLTLQAGNKENTLALSTGDGYLYAASSKDNYLRTETTLSDNSSWSIAVAADGTATLIAQGTNTRNTLYYNKNSKIFSCYSTTQQEIAIYKKASSHTVTIATCTNGSVNASVANGAQVLSGTTITLTPNAETGYKLSAYDVYKTGEESTKVTVADDNTFIMPEFDVTISATFELAKTLTSIEITTPATQTTFWQGETFNHNGLKVTAYFDGADDEDVTDKVTVNGSTVNAGTVAVEVSFTEGATTKTANYDITVKAIPNTKETAYTVADAYDIIDKLTTAEGVFISGIISQVDSYNSSYKSITYWITDESKQLQVYGGKGLKTTENPEGNFESINDLVVNADVVVCGKLKKFTQSGNTIYEFDVNSYLVSYNPPADVEPKAITIDAEIEGGSISIKGNLTEANPGTTITLYYQADDHYTFTSWSVTDENGNPVEVENNTFTMPETAVTISAVFTENAKYTLTLVAEPIAGGSVKFEGKDGSALEYYVDETPTIIAEPNGGYLFNSWSVSGTATLQNASKATTTVTEFSSAVTITANFVEVKEITITLHEPGSKTSTVNCYANQQIYLPNATTLAEGKTFVGWTTNSNLTSATKPASAFYEKNILYTVPATATDLYAVYATASGTEYILTNAASITQGEYVLTDKDYKVATGSFQKENEEGGDLVVTEVGATVNDNKITTLPDGAAVCTLAGNNEDGFTILFEEGYLGYMSTNQNRNLAFKNEFSTIKWIAEAHKDKVNGLTLYSPYGGDSKYRISTNGSGNTTIRGYNNGAAYKELYLFKETSSYSNYTTSVTLQLTMAFEKEVYTVRYGETFETPELQTNYIVTGVTYNSSEPTVASVNTNTGEISTGEIGQTTITATYAGTSEYSAASASYILKVVSPNVDIITSAELTATSTQYKEFEHVGTVTGTTYIGKTAKNGENIQISDDGTRGDGIVSIKSKGYIRSITITFVTSDKQVDIYGSELPYNSSKDLYDNNTRGASLGSLMASGGEYTKTLTIADDINIPHIGIRAKNGAVQIEEIAIEWEMYDLVREVNKGYYGTICLKNNVVKYDGATFFEVAGKEDNKLVFDEVTELEAGKPYIFLAESDELVAIYGTETATEAGEHNSLQGTFEYITDGEAGAVGNKLEGNYMVVNNIIKKCGARCKLPENRAYFVATELENNLRAAPQPMPGRRRVTMGVTGENGTTDLDNITTTDTPVKVIENGQLIIIRDGVKYNVQGQKL